MTGLVKLGGAQSWDQVARNIINAMATAIDNLAVGSGIADGTYGDITVSGTGTVMTINPGAVAGTDLAASAFAEIMKRVSMRV